MESFADFGFWKPFSPFSSKLCKLSRKIKRGEPKMTVYVRRFPCSVCGQNVYWDSVKQTLTCGCGSFKATFVTLQEFLVLPKKRGNKVKCLKAS
jgi:hypothetical protein